MPRKTHLSAEPVVHPSHRHAYDAAYHDVMNQLSYMEWQSVMQLATETKQEPKQVKRVIDLMIREGDDIEVANSEDGKCYRFGGVSRG